MNIKGKKLCDNCFCDLKNEPCRNCGYKKSQYHPEVGILPVGTILKQRYHVGMVLGRGGFGVTYKAYDMQMEKIVAIKEYYPNGIAHRDTGTTQMQLTDVTQKENFSTGAEKFFEEAKTVSRFNGNPNIVSVYEFFYENSTVYYVMEYLEGCDLKHYIKEQGGRITQEQVVLILNVITDALFITHNLNVLHRDISPDNIYITNNGEVKLIDFGAARQVIAEQSKSLSVILKQGFAPLEQYQRKGKQGPWTDIYALGATCLYALTGKVPDDATERIENPQLGDAAEYGVDEKLWVILEKCLAIRTVDRYQSVLELKEALQELDITPVPIALGQKDEIPMTVAVPQEDITYGDSERIQATVAVEMPQMQIKNTDIEEKAAISPILLFLKSRNGIMVIAAILVLLVVAIAAIVITSSSRGKNPTGNNGGNSMTNNSTQQTETENDTESESGQDDTEGDVGEDTQVQGTESNPQPPASEEPTPQPPASEEPSPQPPASEEPTPQPPASEESTPQPPASEEPSPQPPASEESTPQPPASEEPNTQPPASEEPSPQPPTSEEPREEDYVTNRYCTVYLDLTQSSGYSTITRSYEGYYTGAWENGMPNGEGYFTKTTDSICTVGFKTYYIVSGTWCNGVLNGNGTRITVDCKDTKPAPTINTTDWRPYVVDTGTAKPDAPIAYEVGNAGKEWIIILTGTWKDGSPDGIMTKYYAEAYDQYPYYLSGNYDTKFNYNYCQWYLWDLQFNINE